MAKKYHINKGHKYGEWTVLEVDVNHPKRRTQPMYKCQCTCGAISYREAHQIIKHKKCRECAIKETVPPDNRTHGESHTRLYSILSGMKKRCYCKTSVYYAHYGGRGISICTEWHDYVKFRDWAYANGYKEDLSIERIDVNGNYCPENCTWIPRIDQAKNTRQVCYITAFGETKSRTDWLRDPRCKVSSGGLRKRLKTGWTPEAAITTEPSPYKKSDHTKKGIECPKKHNTQKKK